MKMRTEFRTRKEMLHTRIAGFVFCDKLWGEEDSALDEQI
jgi:hypothetical protein